MNKYQELLQVLEKEHQIACEAADIEETTRAKVYFQLLGNLADKETPKKPIDIEFGPCGDLMLSCPTCKHGVVPIPTYHGNKYYPRCLFCGQLLKGDDEDEFVREACLEQITNYIVKLERENFGLKEYKKHQEKANERRYRGGEESWHRGSAVAKKK